MIRAFLKALLLVVLAFGSVFLSKAFDWPVEALVVGAWMGAGAVILLGVIGAADSSSRAS